MIRNGALFARQSETSYLSAVTFQKAGDGRGSIHTIEGQWSIRMYEKYEFDN